MKIPTFQPVQRTNVPKAPDWIDDLRNGDVKQLKRVTQALQGQLSFQDNLNSEVKDVQLIHDTWVEIGLKGINGKAIGLFVISTEYDEFFKTRWKVVDVETVRVRVKWDTDPGQPVPGKVLVFGS